MSKQSSELIFEIKQIHEQYQLEVGGGGYKAWPKSIKERVFELCKVVGSTKQAAELSGIPADTIYGWRYSRQKKNFKSLAVVSTPNRSQTVTVRDEKAQQAENTKIQVVTVTTPRGYKIKGPAEEIAKIIKTFGRL